VCPKEIDFLLCVVVLDWFPLFFTFEVLHVYGSLLSIGTARTPRNKRQGKKCVGGRG